MNVLEYVVQNSDDLDYERGRKLYLTSHRLADFRRCPALYQYKERNGWETESKELKVGRALHTLVLEGDHVFQDRYTSDANAPLNDKTGKPFGPTSDKYKAWKNTQSKEILTTSELDLISNMANSVLSHQETRNLCFKPETAFEQTFRTEDYSGFASQIRTDAVTPLGELFDLKSCADLDAFERDALRFEYPHQMAFYRGVLKNITGQTITQPAWLIAVEKKPPFRTGMWMISEEDLRIAENENLLAMRQLIEAKTSGIFKTRYEWTRLLETNPTHTVTYEAPFENEDESEWL